MDGIPGADAFDLPQAPMQTDQGTQAQVVSRPVRSSPDADTSAEALASRLEAAVEAGTRRGMSEDQVIEFIANRHFNPGKPPARGSEAQVPGSPGRTHDPIAAGETPWRHIQDTGRAPQQQGQTPPGLDASVIEAAEAQAQRSGRDPYEAVNPQPGQEQGPRVGERTYQIGGRTVSERQLQTALGLAERAVKIDDGYSRRLRELEQREMELQARERALQMFPNPQPYGYGAPPAGYAAHGEYMAGMGGQPGGGAGLIDQDFEAGEQQQITPAAVQRMLHEHGQRIRQEIQHEQTNQAQTRATQDWARTLDRAAAHTVASHPAFNDLSEEERRDIEYLVGARIKSDLRLGHLRMPNLPRGDFGSPESEIEAAVRLHVGQLADRHGGLVDRRMQKRLTTYQQQTARIPAPVRNAATPLPGSHIQGAQAKVPDTVDDLIAQLDAVADELGRGAIHGLG